ncbi:MAG: hypothetical protein LBB20_00005, partial [Puniceicoccales bacterium]|nr:hypothetical protein [Puniceicoccales bacterium]
MKFNGLAALGLGISLIIGAQWITPSAYAQKKNLHHRRTPSKKRFHGKNSIRFKNKHKPRVNRNKTKSAKRKKSRKVIYNHHNMATRPAYLSTLSQLIPLTPLSQLTPYTSPPPRVTFAPLTPSHTFTSRAATRNNDISIQDTFTLLDLRNLQYEDEDYTDNYADGTYLIDTMQASLSSLSDIDDPSVRIDRLKENITRFETEFRQLYPNTKLHLLPDIGQAILTTLASAKCELIDSKAKNSNGIKIDNVLKNTKYCDLVSNVNVNATFDEIENKIISSFDSLDYEVLNKILINANATGGSNTIYFTQSNTIATLLHNNFFAKLSPTGMTNNADILFMMTNLSNCLLNADDRIKEKLLTLISNHTDHCHDQAITGIQLANYMAIAYNQKGESDINENIISILVNLYKHLALYQSLASYGIEELEGVSYLTKCMSSIVFPGITAPSYLHHIFGAIYTEDNGDPIKNLDKVLNRINDKERLVDFIWAGVYDGVAIGKEMFGKIVLKDDAKYQELLNDEKNTKAAVNDIEEYNNLIGKADESGDYSKAEAYLENFLKAKTEAVIDYKRNK